MSCIFCKIIKKKAPAEIIYENDNIIVINNIRPIMETHLLVIPKKHMESIIHIKPEDKDLMGELILTAQKVAKDKKLKGYKLAINVGEEGGQEIDHVHLHLLSGKKYVIRNQKRRQRDISKSS